MLIVVMGVAGSGKTVVGQRLAVAMGVAFYDADDFHSAGAVAKMKRGEALDDADRAPWLDRLEELIERVTSAGSSAVLACSALKESYRARLRNGAQKSGTEIKFVYLRVRPEAAAERLRRRPGHYMPASLSQSQFDALEEPVNAVVIDAEKPVDEVIGEALAAIEGEPNTIA